MSDYMDCPVEWCDGYRWEHGGDGADPETWLHSDKPRAIAQGIRINRYREGTGRVEWSLLIDDQAFEGIGLDDLERTLRSAADAVVRLAHTVTHG